MTCMKLDSLAAAKWRLRLRNNEEESTSDSSENDKTIVCRAIEPNLQGTRDKNSSLYLLSGYEDTIVRAV